MAPAIPACKINTELALYGKFNIKKTGGWYKPPVFYSPAD
jgi:hypothetical protein